MSEIEEWKAVVGYEGYYEVSDQGRVRSLGRLVEHGRGDRQLQGRILSPAPWRGYHKVSLAVPASGNRQVTRTVHRLGALAFLLPDPTRTQVNHMDGNKANNRVSNLEWATNNENQEHSRVTGLQKGKYKGRNIQRKLNYETAGVIRELRAQGATCTALAVKYGVTKTCISGVCLGKHWKAKDHLVATEEGI